MASLIAQTFRFRASIVVAAIVPAALHGIGVSLTDSFALSSTTFIGGMLLFVIPFVVGIPFGFKLFDRVFGPDKSWGGLSWSYLKKMAALIFALSLALYLIQQTKRPVTSDANSTTPAPISTESTPMSEPAHASWVAEPEPDTTPTVIAATPLSGDLPSDLVVPPEETAFSSEKEFTIPANTVPVVDAQGAFRGLDYPFVQNNLPAQEVVPYFLGIVRAGMEGVGLCEPSTPCAATVRLRHSGWEAKWEPVPGNTWGQRRQVAKGLVLVQASFTTGSTWNEFLYAEYDGEEWGWRKTSTGWQNIGALSYLPQPRALGTPQYHQPKVNEKAKQVFYKLLACTYNSESRCNAR